MNISLFLFKASATTEIYTYIHTLPLHASLPSWHNARRAGKEPARVIALKTQQARQGEFGIIFGKGDAQPRMAGSNAPLGSDQIRPAPHQIGGQPHGRETGDQHRSEEHTSELHSLIRSWYAVF